MSKTASAPRYTHAYVHILLLRVISVSERTLLIDAFFHASNTSVAPIPSTKQRKANRRRMKKKKRAPSRSLLRDGIPNAIHHATHRNRQKGCHTCTARKKMTRRINFKRTRLRTKSAPEDLIEVLRVTDCSRYLIRLPSRPPSHHH